MLWIHCHNYAEARCWFEYSCLTTLVMLFAEELPILDSAERAQVYRALEAYDGPQITSQEMLPEEIRKIMDL